MDPDKEARRKHERAERAVLHPDAWLAARVASGGEQHLHRHERHREGEQMDHRHRLGPFGPEHRQHQRLGGRREPEIEGQGGHHDDPRRADERLRHCLIVVLDPGIGGERDFVERGDELRDEDLRQEQAGRVDAELVCVRSAGRR